MKIELQTTATKLDCHFIGKVAYPDTEKFEIYKKIFRNAETESSLKELLKNDNINDSAISEFCQTLNKLGLIKENGELTSEPLIAEYGDYILTLIKQAKDEVPYQWLPLQLKRNLQEQDRSYEESLLDSKKLESDIKQTEIFIPKNPIGRVFNIESPETKYSYNGDVPIRIEIDPDTNNWNLNIERNSFSIPEKCQISYQVFFSDKLIKDNTYKLYLPSSKAKNHPDIFDNFTINFEEQQHEIPWGKFNIKYKNVPVLPIVEEVSWWYKSIFKNKLNISGYRTSEDIEFIWDTILSDYPIFQQEEYNGKISKFNYDEVIEQTCPLTEMYWLLYAAKDLDPNLTTEQKTINPIQNFGYQIHIPAKENADIKTDFIDKWQELKSAESIRIYDNYCGTFYSLKTLNEIFKKMDFPPQKVILVSKKQNESFNAPRHFFEDFKQQYHAEIIFLEASNFEHDRYWNIDEKYFTMGTSINNIWTLKNGNYDSRIKSQININEIDRNDIPKKIQDIWSQYV